MNIKKKLKIVRESLFKNHLPLHVNLNHYVYNSISKMTGGKHNSEIATQIKNNGYAIAPNLIPLNLINKIKQKADGYYDSNTHIDSKSADAGLLRVTDCLTNIPEILEILELPTIKEALLSYYGSNFQVFDADIYRTTPKLTPDASFGSQKWHFDNVTNNMVKLMVYLKDVNLDSGAMQIVNKPASARIRKAGFLARSQKEFEPQIIENAIPLEAPQGAGVFFKPQECIHKASEPQQGCRDVIVFMFYPAISAYTIPSADKRTILGSGRSYIRNPFYIKSIALLPYGMAQLPLPIGILP